MTSSRRFFLKWIRTLHIYLTLLAFLLLIFFAATGFMLNHGDWFGLNDVRTDTREGRLPAELLQEPDKLAVVERLRGEFAATGAVDSFEIDDETLRIVFRGVGRLSEATVDRRDGRTAVVRESHGVTGRLADLHKGKAAGGAWSLVIDTVSLLMLGISCTGLMLWLSLQRRRNWGLAAIALGLAVSVGVYLALVP